MAPVPDVNFTLDGYPGMGYTQVPQTFTQEAKPNWMSTPKTAGIGSAGKGIPQMQGGSWFDMPSWGMDAVTGQPLTQQDLQPQAPPPAAAVQQQAPAQQETSMSRLLDQFLAGKMRMFGGQAPGLGAGSLRAIDNAIDQGTLPRDYRVPLRNQRGNGRNSGPVFNQ